MPAKGQKTGYYIDCENCGKTIYQTKTQFHRAKHHFCSNECANKYKHKQNYEDRKCEICGNLFHVSKKSSQRFCSTRCQGKWQSTQIGELNPRFNRLKCVCDNCGKEIFIIPSNYKRFNFHFCCDDCRKEWYSNEFSQNEDWKEESRIRATKILSERKINTNTKPQIIINEMLEKHDIKYENEYNFKYYAMDNYLSDYNLAIEVMGDYWHCSPLKYTTDKINDIQKKRIKMDKAKHTYILKYYNIEILYLWESDIINRYNLCEKLILKYIENYGKLNNYHSFNYHLSNDDILLNNEIIIPYQSK